MHVVGAILAAGMSTRMGTNKLLLPYRGMTVIENVLKSAVDSSLDEILVITGHERERIENAISRVVTARVRPVFNPYFERGRSESIKTAVRNAQDARALLFLVGDKPALRDELIAATIAAFKRERPEICYVKTPTGRGHPIIFSSNLFPELMALEGDFVGDDLIARHADAILEITDEEIQWDINTSDDYRRLLASIPKVIPDD